MYKNLKSSIIAVLVLLLTSCDATVQSDSTITSEPLIVTATLPATATVRPSDTPPPPTLQPTIPPVEGTTSTQLNVRAEPSTASEVIGIIAANSSVQITGKDMGEHWWQIVYDAGGNGRGWVTAQYVNTENSSQVPVIGGGGLKTQSGYTAVIIQQLNIRSGPGTNFDSIGILNADDIVSLTGRNGSGTWLQFYYPAGPDGKGWVNSGFVKTDNSINLPIVSDAGDVIGTGTPVDTPPPPSPTVVPAAMDFDSADVPLKSIILGGAGTHTVLYNGDVSFPEGDTEDWISVTSQVKVLYGGVECSGSASIQIELVGIGNLLCNGNLQSISVSVNIPILIHIQATGQTNQLQYTRYSLKLKVGP